MTRHTPLLHCLPSIHAARPLAIAALAAAVCLAAGPVAAYVSPFDYQKVGATLTYSIEIIGQAHTSNTSGSQWSKADVTRHLEGTLHLAGQRSDMATLDNAQEQITRTARARQAMGVDVPAMQRMAEECGDDDACMSARMMALVNGMSSAKRAALVSATKGPAAKFSQHRRGDWMLDGKTACSIHATSRGASSYRSLDQGEGYAEYVTGSEERHGQGHSDCRHDPYPRASAQWNGDTNLLDLTLPGLNLDERWKSADGKSGTRKIAIPDVDLEHLHWSGKGPQSGQQVRHISVAAGDASVPATMTVRWTLTPNRG